MSSKDISIWKLPDNRLRQNEVWWECFFIGGLLTLTSILYLVNLGSLPLLDPVEGLLAQIAQEIYLSPNFVDWIFPTLNNQAYLDFPPLVPNLIALAYHAGGVNELSTRFPGAFLGGLSVLLVYLIGREIFIARFPALFSALIYLTSIPVLRYSRMATAEGPFLFFELLMIWAALRSRRDLSWTLITGISFSFTCLTQGLVSIQILLLLVLFLWWDTPRLLTSLYFWGGLVLGAIPGITWYIALAIHYHHATLSFSHFIDLLLPWTDSPSLTSGIAEPKVFWQIFQYCLPWLAVMLTGIQLTKVNLHWGWGKLLSVWLGGYFILDIIILHHNYWTLLPIFPALALVTGKKLDQVQNYPSYRTYPQFWIYSFALMAVILAIAALYWGMHNYIDFYLPFICGASSLCLGTTAILIYQQDKQFIPLLFWGLLVSLFLLIISPHWIWELKAQEEVKPIAELLKEYTPPEAKIYSLINPAQPSLSFYSERQIITYSPAELKNKWQQSLVTYLLLDQATLEQLEIPSQSIIADQLGNSLKWKLAIINQS